MKVGVVGDIHWSRYSSIVRQRGDKYSFRLENCIKSINWAEQLTKDCDLIVYMGDFFDTPELNAEEITALKEINWNVVHHEFLVGNHEMGINDLSYSSSHLFDYIKADANVVSKYKNNVFGDVTLHYLPYILEENRKPLGEYLEFTEGQKNIIFSHNDIAGIQLGKIVSKNGFEIKDIEENCDLYLNGHLHNGGKVTDKIINVGNLTGQNFSEDATKYDHCILILDTVTLQCAVYENPYAIHFYKIDTTEEDFDFSTLKTNSVVTLKTFEDKQFYYKNLLSELDKVLTSRIIIVPSSEETQTINDSKEVFSVNHLNKFSEYIIENLGKSEVVMSELSEVLK